MKTPLARRRCYLEVLLLIFLSMLAANCATKLPPNIQAEGQMAQQARQLIVLAGVVLDSVDLMTEQRLALSPPGKAEAIKADARAAIMVIRDVGLAGQQLAEVLKVVDLAKEPGTRLDAIQAAQGLLRTISGLLSSGSLRVGDEATRMAVAKLLGPVSDLVLQMALLLPRAA